MSKIKINRNRPQVSSEEIVKLQNYDAFLKAYKAYQGLGLKMLMEKLFLNKPLSLTIGIGTTVMVSVLTYNTIFKSSNSVPTNSSRDIAPIEILDVPYEIFEIEKFRQEATFNLSNGTIINVPPRTFVNSDGKVYRRKVTLKYREFHNSFDIMAAGIPMHIDSADNRGQLETAGMIEILAFGENGEPLFLADGKTIDVKLASFVSDDNYNYYYYDDENGWEYKGLSKPRINEEKKEKLDKIEEELGKPIIPRQYKDGALIFDLRVNTRKYPELKSLKKILWEYVGDDSLDTREYEWVFAQKWEDIELVRNKDGSGTYTLNLEKGDKSISTLVAPVFAGKAFDEAMEQYEKDLEKYGTRLDRRKDEIDRLRFEADVFRDMAITDLGLWNCDRWINMDSYVNKPAYFQLPETQFRTKVFHFTANSRTVFTYTNPSAEGFTFDSNGDNFLVAVIGDGKFTYLQNDEIEKAIRENRGVVNFDLTRNVTEAESLDQLKDNLSGK